ncbi:MAG: glycosyltransferase family 4 protein [Candidatus Thermoplasmatota archaeon]
MTSKVVLAAIRYPPAPGGAETHVAALAEGLAKRGHDVVVHTSDLFTEYPFERRSSLPDKVNGIPVVRHRAVRVGGAWTTMPSMGKALRAAANEADIIHAHSYGYYQTVVASREAKRAGKPFVFTPHFHPPWSMEGGAWRRALRSLYDPWLGQRVVDAASRVIAVSSGELEEMRVHLRVPNAVVIPNGFHAAHYASVPDGAPFRARFGLGDSPVVLFAGRLASNKGLITLLDAFARLRGDARLVLAGQDQGWRARLEEQARGLGIRERVTFTGHLDDGAYRSALSAADVLALPSEWEAFGIVLAEAMACGTPCVGTRVGGAPDVIVDEETGFLVPYGDAVALAKAFERILCDDALAARMGHAGRARAMQSYSWDAVVERTIALYAEVGRR